MASSNLRLIILGAPGSGKGTISKRIVKEFGLPHLSSGDVLRSNIASNTVVGVKVKDLVTRGQLVSDEIVTKIVADEMHKIGDKKGWLLDGFPRTLDQAKSLDNNKLSADMVVNLNVPFEIIINRLKHRWVHAASGRVYNLEFNPPKTSMKDDLTGEALTQREDDKAEVVLKRLKIYESITKPMIDYYLAQNKIQTFTGETSDYLWPLIKSELHSFAKEGVTHTGQKYDVSDYRRARFDTVDRKIVNKNVAMELVAKDPIVVVNARSIWSDGGGPLGHPRIYINLDRDEVLDCGYSGRRFIQKKYYKKEKHGESITYEDYIETEKAKAAA